jgi:hypothetical protein
VKPISKEALASVYLNGQSDGAGGLDQLRSLRARLPPMEWDIVCRTYVNALLDETTSNMVLTITGPKWTKVPLGAEPERAPNRIDFVPPDPDRPR